MVTTPILTPPALTFPLHCLTRAYAFCFLHESLILELQNKLFSGEVSNQNTASSANPNREDDISHSLLRKESEIRSFLLEKIGASSVLQVQSPKLRGVVEKTFSVKQEHATNSNVNSGGESGAATGGKSEKHRDADGKSEGKEENEGER